MVHRQELRDKKRLVVFIVCFVGKHGLFFTEQGVCPEYGKPVFPCVPGMAHMRRLFSTVAGLDGAMLACYGNDILNFSDI